MDEKVKIEPMGIPELSYLLDRPVHILRMFYRENKEVIGKRLGQKFSTKQVEIFIDHFHIPHYRYQKNE